jgi:hypothetical protein
MYPELQGLLTVVRNQHAKYRNTVSWFGKVKERWLISSIVLLQPQGKKQKSQSKKDDLNRHNIATLVLWVGKPETNKQRRKPN